MAHSTGSDYELESKINEMSSYLDNLMLSEEKDCHIDLEEPSCSGTEASDTTSFNRRTPPIPYIPAMSLPVISMNLLPSNYGISITPAQYHLTSVTSALATRMKTNSSTLRFINPAPHPRTRKWGSYKQAEKEPDTSGIDIDATMAELGLTAESLTNNEVYRLFTGYQKLAFYINADFIFETIYDGRTLPNTMSASVQTRHAVWSSNKLLRQLRDVLKKHTNVPTEYEEPHAQCKQSLEELHMAILKLETFKYCVLEHRRGQFISGEARENLEPLIDALNQVTECVGKSRMYIRVIEWALEREQPRAETSAGSSSDGPSPPLPGEGSFEPNLKGRPMVARRYIG